MIATTKRTSKTYLESMQGFADEYLAETKRVRITTAELAEWAIRTGRWMPPRDISLRLCKQDFAKAMRTIY